MASTGVAGRPNSELAMMANVYRRWIEINGDEPIRTYSSRHADKYIEMMSQIPGNYGKGKIKELPVDALIKYAKRNRIKALLTTKTIKTIFPSCPSCGNTIKRKSWLTVVPMFS